ncbi:HlyD family type I secretion periplasmic adaptor subunit [cf. Phormidesmis sp. LEGE 11477]|uniref:HlyD family type I secretion periplasmic adaptor subunit n=1 Tax=cf. Phormidesmis sp. LEGE 11477 TaxID=1828680 RepID=UPI001882914F|nr:HlyD family type I secretion periplasmic adaptor subunit [cf. Phormidesmis sp. LEGE 11477]MBE9059447.1 HlyD family type I secretion periplasmic adaptor subunit [cf. Phormidesmis sp. LEGE 11477]
MTSTSNRPKLVPGNGSLGNGQAGGNGASGSGNGGFSTNGGPSNGDGDAPVVPYVPQSFDQPVILKQSPRWAKAIALSIMGVTVASVTWACIARVEETVAAQGKLEPEGVVQVVQAPVGGVVEEIMVTEGELVERGQVVATLDETATEAQLESNRDIAERLNAENDYYRAQLSGAADAVAPAGISADLVQRGRDRAQLLASNQLYQAQITGDTAGLSPEQLDRMETATSRLASQQQINRLQSAQLSEQLNQTRLQLANARSELATNQDILSRFKVLNEEGAVAELSYLQQKQEVNNSQTQVNTLKEEVDRLSFQISQANQEVSRTSFESRETLQDRISVNNQRIAEIDSQLTQRLLENDRQLSELASQRAQLAQSIKYQALTAPVTGTVFNLKANRPGYVANSTEPMMEIVPQDALVARVFIPNRDIGFVQVGQKVDVRIDAYSFSEFGDVEGTLTSIGTDALPPDEVFPFYRFPAEVLLDSQQFVADGVPLELRSGMSLNANIKLRKRRVITFLTDLFQRKLDAVTSGS